jgi:CBS domain containing-hemolysin-like protein
VGANGFFVAAELGLVAADRARIDRDAGAGRRRARLAQAAVHRLAFYLSGIQLAVTAVSLILGVVAAPAIAQAIESPMASLVGESHAHGASLAVGFVLATVGTALFGELAPKNLAVARPVRVAYFTIGPLTVYSAVFGPLIRALNRTANAAVRRLGIEPQEELASVRSLEELELLIRSSGEEGSLDAGAVNLLTRTLRFNNKTAADALVPRPAMTTIESGATVGDLVDLSFRTGYSRFPITGSDIDDITGVVHVREALRLPFETRAASPVTEIASEPFVIPETRDLGSLLAELRDVGTHMAVVVDEFGGTAGLITQEDIVEEIVGEIADEYDPATPSRTQWQPRGTFVVPGSMHTDEVADATRFEMPEGDYETLAGFVLARLGRIPQPGDAFEHAGWRIEVVSMDRLRVETVRLVAPGDANATGGAEPEPA